MTTTADRIPRLALLTAIGLLTACAADDGARVQSTPRSADALLRQARQRDGAEAARLTVQAAAALADAGQHARALQALAGLPDPSRLPGPLLLDHAVVQARIAERDGDIEAAIEWLNGPAAAFADPATERGIGYFILLGRLSSAAGRPADAAGALAAAAARDGAAGALWRALGGMGTEELAALAGAAATYELRGWVELMRTWRAEAHSIRRQLDAIARWQRVWPAHPAARSLPVPVERLERVWAGRPRHVALILPLREPAGAAIQEGFLGAYYQALEGDGEAPRLSIFDSSGAVDALDIHAAAAAAGADFIVGPLDKTLVSQLHRARRLPVRTLALNYADRDGPGPANLFQFGLAPEDEIDQAAALAWRAGYRQAAVLAPRAPEYQRLELMFSGRWEALGGAVVSRTAFGDDYAEAVRRLMGIDRAEARAERLLALLPRRNMEFTPRRRADIDFVFLIANPGQGRQLKPTLEFYFAEDLPVFAMPSIHDGADGRGGNRDLDGIVFTDAPWILDRSGDPSKARIDDSLRPVSGALKRLRALGVDGFRLRARLEQMADGASYGGATGLLTLSPDRRVHRALTAARFAGGVAAPLEPGPAGAD